MSPRALRALVLVLGISSAALAGSAGCGSEDCRYEPQTFCVDKSTLVASCNVMEPDASSLDGSLDGSGPVDPARAVACPSLSAALACGQDAGWATSVMNYSGQPTDYGDRCCYAGYTSKPVCVQLGA